MSETVIIQLITATTAIISVLCGSIGAYLGTKHIERIKMENEKKSLQAGFISEIRSLIALIEKREYLRHFEDTLKKIEIAGPKHREKLYIHIPDGYAIFYRTNAGKVGLLSPEKTQNIILFHQLLQAVVQDFHSDAHTYKNGFDYETLSQAIDILRQAIDVGEKIVL